VEPLKLNYFEVLKRHLRLDPTLESSVIKEIRAHLEDRSRELQESGLSEEEATSIATRVLGPPQLLARQIYEVYSQGTWRQSLCAALPHLLVALLFALRFWQSIFWLATVIMLVVGTTIYGWYHGRPDWLFPWLGYSLVPVIATGALLIYLPGAWSWFALIAYLPLVLLVIVSVTKAALKRDWIFASLMLLPLPITLGWIITIATNTYLPWQGQIQRYAPLITLSFSILAIASMAFVRMKQRWAKLGVLVILEAAVLAIIVLVGKDFVSPGIWLFLALLGVFLLFGPAVLEQGLTRNRSRLA
jgi:hypothetical protein